MIFFFSTLASCGDAVPLVAYDGETEVAIVRHFVFVLVDQTRRGVSDRFASSQRKTLITAAYVRPT